MMSERIILSVKPLQFPWQPSDPFLFCAHHDDHFPEGNKSLGPQESLAGRHLGMDFSRKDGWSMYHGEEVPGFPRHPHRGFETITVARKGYIDHADSMGATARFGMGDVQWMTAGKGVVHSEMFPLVNQDSSNHTELFQIWLNLPQENKFTESHFKMMWSHTIPRQTFSDEQGRESEVTIIAGKLGEHEPPTPPPGSWASREDADVAIWTLRMAPRATWTVPPAKPGSHRTFFFFAGDELEMAGEQVRVEHSIEVRGDRAVSITNGTQEAELLMLQGRPINEPVAQRGPFVMNTQEEIYQAMIDYQRTGFGGWPWKNDGPTHPREKGRFAIHADGKEESPE